MKVIFFLALFVAVTLANPVPEQEQPAAPAESTPDQDAQNQFFMTYGYNPYGYGLPYAAALPAVKAVAAPVAVAAAVPSVKYVAPAVSSYAYSYPAYSYGYSYGNPYAYHGYPYVL